LQTHELTPATIVVPWWGYGNVVTAAGTILVDLLERA